MNSTDQQDPPKPDKKSLEECVKAFETLASAEEKIREAIDFMRGSIAHSSAPDFRSFWEIRKRCLPVFKDVETSPSRTQLWGEYIELTKEGRQLKSLLDEESAFAVEQIDIAIAALEEELGKYTDQSEEILSKTPEVFFVKEPQSVEGRSSLYQQRQRRLNFLNTYASRINALRKELIKTEMRLRQKNKLFQRLSKLGDLVFPTRRELIKEISDYFADDVKGFIQDNFSESTFCEEKVRRGVFYFREEIKSLQGMAKVLTLNTHSFSLTREQLSSCWDKLKGMEKELKKESSEHKQLSTENRVAVLAAIEEVSGGLQEGKLSGEEGLKNLDEILRKMREIQLIRGDVHFLKDAIKKVRDPLHEKQEREHLERKKAFEKKKNQQIEALSEKIVALKERVPSVDVETLNSELDSCQNELKLLAASREVLEGLKNELKNIRDKIIEKEEEAILNLSDGDRATLESLHSVLDQRKQRRHEVKVQIEECRKIIGGSSLDFEKAMQMNERMACEKERLEKIDEGISEIEQKIKELKKRA
ncbi:MAG: hypothetical protein KR126chlam2_01081 [Chlamydiae bacterium]|nr:hypothetical protein [Chlamydiota bacterium]